MNTTEHTTRIAASLSDWKDGAGDGDRTRDIQHGTTNGTQCYPDNVAYTITPSGVFHALRLLPGGSEGPLLQGSDGNFYATTLGSVCGADTVFKLTATGKITALFTFPWLGPQGDRPYGGLVQGTDGNFYGTATGGGAFNQGTVFKITPKGVVTVLHSFAGDLDGYAPYAGLVLATDGNFYGRNSWNSLPCKNEEAWIQYHRRDYKNSC